MLAAPRVIPVGAETRPRLTAVAAERISTVRLRGITEYEPDEFTIAALAGTPVREVVATLAERGQHLPFEPQVPDARRLDRRPGPPGPGRPHGGEPRLIMLHTIPPAELGPLGEPMAKAVSACVHCGFCLAACPTYLELGQGMDTPRGRIVLMKEVLEGRLGFAEAQAHVDRCLGCLACEPACPSGVPYRDLISPFRTLGGVPRGRHARSRRPPASVDARQAPRKSGLVPASTPG